MSENQISRNVEQNAMTDTMIDALKAARAAQGKETEEFHITNEIRLVNSLAGGNPDKLAELTTKNTALITAGMEYAERKKFLSERAGGLTETAILEVDALLKLVEAFRMSPQEVVKLDKAGHAPADSEGYYNAALSVLQWRTATSAAAAGQIEELTELAAYDGITLEPGAPDVPEVHIPIFGIGLL